MAAGTANISIVIPLYNEAQSLPELTRRITEVCEAHDLDFEAWLIDDGSTDNSWDVIEQIHDTDPRYQGVQLRRNYGKSAALAVGFKRVKGTKVVTMDADLQDDPAEIPALIERLDQGYDIVSGWKKERKDPWTKTLPSKFFNWVTRIVSGIPLHDFNCGLKAYRTKVVKNLKIYGELHRYIPVLAKWEGFTEITEKPVQHHPRKYGETKFGVTRLVKGFLDLISVAFLTRFAARPIHFFGSLGTLAFLFGFVINAYLTVLKFMGEPLSNRPLLFLGILLILLGVQLFSIGLLGEMIIQPAMEDTDTYRIQEETISPSRKAKQAMEGS